MLLDESVLAFCARNPFDQTWKISSYQAPRHCSGGVVFGSVFPWKKKPFIHHFTLRNVMLWKKAWRKQVFGKKNRLSCFEICNFLEKNNNNNNNKKDNSKTKTKKQRELKKNRKSSHEETALSMSCLAERKFPLPFTNGLQEYCF